MSTSATDIANNQSARTQEADFPVEGMTCSACAVRLEKALNRVAGIEDAVVNFALERANVTFDPRQTDVPAIANVVTKAGFGVGNESFSFGVGGMTCSSCAQRIEKALHRLDGVLEANVNLALERVDIQTAC